MFGNVTALEWLHVTVKYSDRIMQHTCSRRPGILTQMAGAGTIGYYKMRFGRVVLYAIL